ncbi:hypothetical protein PIB30_105381, partial [Stylosanthes scabra]|nr:hypothetical protein [Stylosanthes scabra]
TSKNLAHNVLFRKCSSKHAQTIEDLGESFESIFYSFSFAHLERLIFMNQSIYFRLFHMSCSFICDFKLVPYLFRRFAISDLHIVVLIECTMKKVNCLEV